MDKMIKVMREQWGHEREKIEDKIQDIKEHHATFEAPLCTPSKPP